MPLLTSPDTPKVTMSLRDLAIHASEQTGLPVETCGSLLTNGWTLILEYGKNTRWEHPIANLEQ